MWEIWCSVYTHYSVSLGLPITPKRDPSSLDSSVPIVADSCGVYGTFYVDLVGNGLKTFNSPGRRPKMPHGLPHQQGAETIQIFTQPVAKSSPLGSCEALVWKQAIRPQPKMGVLRESWEKNHSKQGEQWWMVWNFMLLPPHNVLSFYLVLFCLSLFEKGMMMICYFDWMMIYNSFA